MKVHLITSQKCYIFICIVLYVKNILIVCLDFFLNSFLIKAIASRILWNITSAIRCWRSFLFSICFLFTQPQELLLCCNDSRCKVFFTAFVGSWVFSLVLNLIPCAPRAGEEKAVQLMTTFYILLLLLQIAIKILSLEVS